MKITKTKIKSFKPCDDGYDWYLNNGSNDLKETLLNVSKVNFSWAIWLITKLMNEKQNLELAIFAAEKVLYIYEAKYDDLRPHNAILAAKKVLENDNEENRELAREAAYAAYYDFAYSAADAAYTAAYSANTAAAYAACSSSYATSAANAATHSSKKSEFQIEIIDKAMEILERKV